MNLTSGYSLVGANPPDLLKLVSHTHTVSKVKLLLQYYRLHCSCNCACVVTSRLPALTPQKAGKTRSGCTSDARSRSITYVDIGVTDLLRSVVFEINEAPWTSEEAHQMNPICKAN